MHIKIYYGGSLITECNGEDVENMIENSFRHLDSIIHEHSGNAAGFTSTKVYIEHDSSANDIAWLHVFAHGNDGLINYDPITDTDKEILFKVTGITNDNLPTPINFELTEKKFDPFNPEWLKNKAAALGILKQCIDHLAASKGKYAPRVLPSEMVDRKFPTMQKNNLPVYISQLMLQFSLANVKVTEKNKKIFELIEKTSEALIETKRGDDNEVIFYYKTSTYFESVEKITALQHYRKESGKSQQDVADAVGISLRQYQRYESTSSSLGNAKKAIIEKMAETIGVSATDIVKNGFVILM